MMDTLTKNASEKNLTPYASALFDSAFAAFEEYADGSCEADTLDNYFFFLWECTDDILKCFTISYYTELGEYYEGDEYETEGYSYEDPSIILTPIKPMSFGKLYITCRGYEMGNGDHIRCDVNEDNSKEACQCVELIQNELNNNG